MNRRSFISILAALPAGVCAAFAKLKRDMQATEIEALSNADAKEAMKEPIRYFSVYYNYDTDSNCIGSVWSYNGPGIYTWSDGISV